MKMLLTSINLTLATLMLAAYVEGARILCVSQQFKSHQLMVHSIGAALIQSGHEVYTVYSDKLAVPDELVDSGFNILRFHTPDGHNLMAFGGGSVDMVEHILKDGNHGRMETLKKFSAIALGECMDMDNDTILYKQLIDLQFDLVIADIFPLANCMPFMALKLKIPFVVSPASLEIEISRSFNLPSVIPMFLTTFTDNMNYFERIENIYGTVQFNWAWMSGLPGVIDVSLLEKYNTDPRVKSWNDLVRKAELLLISRGFILDYPSFLSPKLINIECLTCKPGKPLSKYTQDMIGKSEAIIVVSLGSFVDELPKVIAAKFVEAFRQRQELVLWRYNGQLPGKVPPNLKVMNWLPQNDLLADPRTKLFITHSGNNGQYESVYHGVPMLAFPIFAEQPFNAVRMVKRGYGLKVDIMSFTANELAAKMEEIMTNSSYREKVQKASGILKSRPMTATQTAVYWIEHILRFGGDHLQSHSQEMPWYSAYMFDIIVFLHIVVFAIIVFIVGLCYLLVSFICWGKSKQKQN